MTAELCEAIEGIAPQLATQVLDVMYRNPFWDARYGTRGRKHAEADSGYHISYLLEALRADDARIMVRYAQWLRTVLVSRGMSSAHLAENFALLAGALSAQLRHAEPAVRILDVARAALRHEHGLAHWLEQNESGLQRAMLAQLGADEARLVQVRDWYPHLVDAAAAGRFELFLEHLRWLRVFHAARVAELADELRALGKVCEGHAELSHADHEHLQRALAQAASFVAAPPGEPSTQ